MTKYTTYAEYLATPEFKAVRAEVLRRSGGLCENEIQDSYGFEKCGEPATEVHHVQYCRWGEFDPPGNLLAMCHKCHEDAHRCDTCGEVVLKAEAIKANRTTCFDCYTRNQD